MPSNFVLGFDYYPEHWGEEEWPQDLTWMRELGVSCIRIAEYAWTRLEPEEGRFEFAWLDRFFELCAKHEMSIILGTPSDGIPPWAWQKYPEVVSMEEDGRRDTTWRRMKCPTSAKLAQLVERINTKLCERYGNHPQLIGWQIDNEVTGKVCYCESCQNACREWLKNKFGTVEKFNKDLGLVFWAHEVTDWDQVTLPRFNMERAHPSILLEVQKFFSDAWAQFLRRQYETLHRLCPGRWVTHNLPGVRLGYDMFDATAALDFMSMDMYPKAMLNGRTEVGFRNDITRSLQERPHWVLEIQSGTPCTKFYKAPIPREGQLRLWAHQCAAHGAEGVVFFRWRKSPAGQEMFGNGLLDHDSRPRRAFHEVKRLGEDFAQLARILPQYENPREVAIVFDFGDRVNTLNHKVAIDMEFIDHLEGWWEAFRDLGLNVRFVRSTDDLTPYKMVLAVTQFTTTPEIVRNFTQYVERGGTLVGALRMGFFDVYGKPSRQTLPGGMTDLFGVEVEEYERIMAPNPNTIKFADGVGGTANCLEWNYILNDLGAKPLATYQRDYYAGRTCISEHAFGKGKAAYVGTVLERQAKVWLLRHLAKGAGLSVLSEDWPGDVEYVRMADGEGKSICALLNHGLEPHSVTLPDAAQDMLGESSGKEWHLEPLGFRWLKRDAVS